VQRTPEKNDKPQRADAPSLPAGQQRGAQLHGCGLKRLSHVKGVSTGGFKKCILYEWEIHDENACAHYIYTAQYYPALTCMLE
jgi:hypothetical protein